MKKKAEWVYTKKRRYTWEHKAKPALAEIIELGKQAYERKHKR